jgi:hypothetical protein
VVYSNGSGAIALGLRHRPVGPRRGRQQLHLLAERREDPATLPRKADDPADRAAIFGRRRRRHVSTTYRRLLGDAETTATLATYSAVHTCANFALRGQRHLRQQPGDVRGRRLGNVVLGAFLHLHERQLPLGRNHDLGLFAGGLSDGVRTTSWSGTRRRSVLHLHHRGRLFDQGLLPRQFLVVRATGSSTASTTPTRRSPRPTAACARRAARVTWSRSTVGRSRCTRALPRHRPARFAQGATCAVGCQGGPGHNASVPTRHPRATQTGAGLRQQIRSWARSGPGRSARTPPVGTVDHRHFRHHRPRRPGPRAS